MSNGRVWQSPEIDLLRVSYPNLPTKELAQPPGRSEPAVYGQAGLLELKKSAVYLASPEARRLR